jgi:hypothetical protein
MVCKFFVSRMNMRMSDQFLFFPEPAIPSLIQILESCLRHCSTQVALQLLYVVCNLASSSPEVLSILIKRPSLLSAVLPFLVRTNRTFANNIQLMLQLLLHQIDVTQMSEDAGLRTAGVWVVSNLVARHQPGVHQRVTILNELGFGSQLKDLATNDDDAGTIRPSPLFFCWILRNIDPSAWL